MTATDVCFDCFGEEDRCAGCPRCRGTGLEPSTEVPKPEVPAAARLADVPPPGDEDAPLPEHPAPIARLPARHDPPPEPLPPPAVKLRIVTAEEFAAVHEPGADPLLGAPGEALLPSDGDVMLYGDGGAGKTTLLVDMGAHLAAGDDWLGIPVPSPLTVLLVENEGPRSNFRRKLDAKLGAWTGSPLGGRLRVLEDPWASISLGHEQHRQALADVVTDGNIDVLIIGPVTRSGMTEAGTLEDVRQYTQLVGDVRRRVGRPMCVVLVHHQNRAGSVSGAWEGAVDTLLHLSGQGHGKARLYVQKARWSTAHHATTMQLLWADGAGFTVDDKPELDDTTIAENIFTVIADNPGIGWTEVERLTPGVSKRRRREVRDGLLKSREIVNVAKVDGAEALLDHCPERRTARLYPAADPTIGQLRPASGADGAQLELAEDEGVQRALRPAPRPIRGAGVGADAAPSGWQPGADQ